MKIPLLVSLLIFNCFGDDYLLAQQKKTQLLDSILSKNDDSLFVKVRNEPRRYRLQIIYTQINRDKHNKPHFTNYFFHFDSSLYFNPASMVKMPLAFLSLEKLNRLNISKYTSIVFDSSRPWHKPMSRDTTAKDARPTIAHFIKRAFLISENDPYNRMYQFMGQRDINRILHRKGYSDVRITRQFMGLTETQNRETNPLRLITNNGRVVFKQPTLINNDSFDFSRKIKLGKAYYDAKDSLVHEPFDFTEHNFISLMSMQQMLQSVLFPESAPISRRFNLSKDDYKFLYRYLSQYPSESDDPKYDTSIFYDSYVKFYFRDSTLKMPTNVRVFNKVGWSYGFLTDVSYVVDFKNKVEFMLSCNMYVNSDDVLNDDHYDYDNVGHPFLFQLGQTIYRYELQRVRLNSPDLSRFKINYEKRDPHDNRPSLSRVDN